MCIIPVTHPSLHAVNRIAIHTYSTRSVALCTDGQQFLWKFTVAAVDRPLLGSDFIATHGFLVDIQGRHFIHSTTFCTLVCA